MTTTEHFEVQIGDERIRLRPYGAVKGFKVLRTLRDLAEAVPNLDQRIGDYRNEYRAANYVELDRSTAVYRDPERAHALTEEDWIGSGQKLRIPTSPSFEQIVIGVFPTVYNDAEPIVQKLLALVLEDDDAIDQHYRDGDLDEHLEVRTVDLMTRAKFGQLVRLASVAVDQVRVELADYREDLGNLRSLWPTEPAPVSDPASTTPQAELDDEAAPASSSGPSTDSSGSSPAAGDGAEPTPSPSDFAPSAGSAAS